MRTNISLGKNLKDRCKTNICCVELLYYSHSPFIFDIISCDFVTQTL